MPNLPRDLVAGCLQVPTTSRWPRRGCSVAVIINDSDLKYLSTDLWR